MPTATPGLFDLATIQTLGAQSQERNQALIQEAMASAPNAVQRLAAQSGGILGSALGNVIAAAEGVDTEAPVAGQEVDMRRNAAIMNINAELQAAGLDPSSAEGLRFAGKKFQAAGLLDRALEAGKAAEIAESKQIESKSKLTTTKLQQERLKLQNEKLRLELAADSLEQEAEQEAGFPKLDETGRAVVARNWKSFENQTAKNAEAVAKIDGLLDLIDSPAASESGFIDVITVNAVAKMIDPSGKVTDNDFLQLARAEGMVGQGERVISGEFLKGSVFSEAGRKKLRNVLVKFGKNRAKEINQARDSIINTGKDQGLDDGAIALTHRRYTGVDRFLQKFGGKQAPKPVNPATVDPRLSRTAARPQQDVLQQAKSNEQAIMDAAKQAGVSVSEFKRIMGL